MLARAAGRLLCLPGGNGSEGLPHDSAFWPSQSRVSHGTILGVQGFPIDFISGVKYFKRAADQGHSRGQAHYGLCLLKRQVQVSRLI
jgi:TPR repeat protein